MKSIARHLSLGLILLAVSASFAVGQSLDDGWESPPREARLRAYWWWLNGCVTREAITRDLEEMKAKGFGGALICDADGSSQDGNERAPHGPDFFSPEWRELFKHTLREADRLGLEMSLNIQSGWNLGGPVVSADDAGKKLVWSEARVTGPATFQGPLPQPAQRDGYYRDAIVVAYPIQQVREEAEDARVTASSAQPSHPVDFLIDGDGDSFWVSEGAAPGKGPAPDHPEWIEFAFTAPLTIDRLVLLPRPGYGPHACRLLVSDDGREFRTAAEFAITNPREEFTLSLDPVSGRVFRLMILGAYDRGELQNPRNVQIRELRLAGPDGAWPRAAARRPIRNWAEKAGYRPLHFSAPDTTPLLEEDPPVAGEEDVTPDRVIDLTDKLGADGTLTWEVPEGDWQILRFGYTISDRAYVSTCSQGWEGYALDVLDAGAFERYWDAVVEPLLADAGPMAGKTLRYLHTDSWEIEPLNWTPTLPAEFQRRRGYAMTPWMPVLAGRIVGDRPSSNRFLYDFRKTLGDLAIEHHYRPFRDRAHRLGLEIHPESGGPHAVPIDAQRCLGFNDVPMSEFWAWSWRHRIGDANRFFVKQPASAAHTYGRRFVAAEGFTTIGPHWQETLWDNLKPSFDKACCEGFNLLFWHAFVCSPQEHGLPGLQYFAGTHLNPNVTWWSKSKPFFDYINRCQFMLQQGLFVADACYYYGDHVPNFTQYKGTDPAKVLPGYDYDVITAEALLTRAGVESGRIVLPDGMSYRVLVLPSHGVISLPVLRKIGELAESGVTIVGPHPRGSPSLSDDEAEHRRLVEELWDRGRVIADKTAREVLQAAGVPPDCEFSDASDVADLDYIHRRTDAADIYFVANRGTAEEHITATFRVSGKAPELWDAVTGRRSFADVYSEKDGRTAVSLNLPPCGSVFVVFREPAAGHPPESGTQTPRRRVLREIAGPWQVTFDPQWGGPGTVTFEKLDGWTEHSEPGIRYYAGTAIYENAFEVPDAWMTAGEGRVWLDLGSVRELAEVFVNDRSCGIVWAPPFRVDIGGAIRSGKNRLRIEVVNFWPNRIIGDASLPEDRRLTRTNIRKLTADTELMPSGLFGPVRLERTEGATNASAVRNAP
ncbi:MAG: hypothetical protein Kow0040_19900 [Thermogutta sp.]